MSNTDADLLKRLREIDEDENTKFASAHEDDEADDEEKHSSKTASTKEGQDALNEIANLLSKSAEDDDDSEEESDDDSDDNVPDQFKKNAFSKKAFDIEAEILESVVKTAGAKHVADSADKLAQIRRNLYS